MAPRIGRFGLLAVAALASGAGPSDPGVVLQVDRNEFALQARDLRGPEIGPRLVVALGSPANPTPRGVFRLDRVVRNPAWFPGNQAREAGARPLPASPHGPLGVAKIPFAEGGALALHGGAHPLVLGKPVSLGCVRSADDALLGLIAWLDTRDALAEVGPSQQGEFERRFRRPVRLVVR